MGLELLSATDIKNNTDFVKKVTITDSNEIITKAEFKSWIAHSGNTDLDTETNRCPAEVYMRQKRAPFNLTAIDASFCDNGIAKYEIDLSWTVGDFDLSMRIYRSTGGAYSLLVTKAAGATTHKDTGLISGTTYNYKAIYLNQSSVEAGDFSNVASETVTASNPCGGPV